MTVFDVRDTPEVPDESDAPRGVSAYSALRGLVAHLATRTILALAILSPGACSDDTLVNVGGADLTTNVLLVVVDTLRADHVGSYGGRARTPNMDALARSGVRFERAYSHIPLTGPSHASLFTSLLPRAHGVRNNLQPLAARG